MTWRFASSWPTKGRRSASEGRRGVAVCPCAGEGETRPCTADTRIFKYFAGTWKWSEGRVVAAAQGRGVMLLVIVAMTRGVLQAGPPSRRGAPRCAMASSPPSALPSGEPATKARQASRMPRGE